MRTGLVRPTPALAAVPNRPLSLAGEDARVLAEAGE